MKKGMGIVEGLVMDLLIKLGKTGGWKAADTIRLDRLTRLANIINKLRPAGSAEEAVKPASAEEDRKIIADYVKRYSEVMEVATDKEKEELLEAMVKTVKEKTKAKPAKKTVAKAVKKPAVKTGGRKK